MSFKRRTWIVTPRIQYKVILLVCLSVVTPAILLGISVLYNLWHIQGLLSGPPDLLETAVEDFIHTTTMSLILGIPAIVCIIACWSMVITNRIVGPIHRLEKELDEIIATRQFREIGFRKDDAFHGLAERINTLVKGVVQRPELETEYRDGDVNI